MPRPAATRDTEPTDGLFVDAGDDGHQCVGQVGLEGFEGVAGGFGGVAELAGFGGDEGHDGGAPFGGVGEAEVPGAGGVEELVEAAVAAEAFVGGVGVGVGGGFGVEAGGAQLGQGGAGGFVQQALLGGWVGGGGIGDGGGLFRRQGALLDGVGHGGEVAELGGGVDVVFGFADRGAGAAGQLVGG